jgi:hypothetical protein
MPILTHSQTWQLMRPKNEKKKIAPIDKIYELGFISK